ncbi:hypothetical protein NMY22_g18425 [Coprinellus aureogranulatus]|nr:hypothetical protein NMY22_g18425 [Coprinellus aureogranulatus]
MIRLYSDCANHSDSPVLLAGTGFSISSTCILHLGLRFLSISYPSTTTTLGPFVPMVATPPQHEHPHASLGTPGVTHLSSAAIANEEYIFTFAPKDRLPLSNSAKNAKTSRVSEIEELDSYEELGYRVYELREVLAESLYAGIVDPNRAVDFLKTPQSGYDIENGSWRILPSDPTSEADLRGPFVKIFNAIEEHFNPSPSRGTTCEAVDSHNIPMAHDNGVHFTSPGICIKATGPSFEVPEHAGRSRGLGYTNVAAVLEVKLDKAKGKRMMHCQRMATYNRQIFIQQPSRHFVRSLLLTEKVFRLVHFDRSGIYVTPLFDIHKDASVLVQFVAGLMSPSEAVLGFDTSIQWTVDESSGKKVAGIITLNERDEETGAFTEKKYNLDITEAPFVRPGIRGRGTVAWNAKDPATGAAVIIKDSWHTDSRASECEFIRKAKGIPGIVEILVYQQDCSQTISYRPLGYKSKDFRNRFKLRLVLKRYGAPIWFFRSRLQLLYALRDVLVGHRELFMRGIIHRDISMLNILLGEPGAEEGYRGILIDLDMAAYTEDFVSSLPADPQIGTRIYQSVSVISALSTTPPPPQDYSDDLESLFYVYCQLVYDFEQPGVRKKEGSELLADWDLDDTRVVANTKAGFVLSATNMACIPPYWGKACATLLKEFHEVIRGIVMEKDRINADRKLDAEAELKAYHSVARDHGVYFGKVKAAFDKAIAVLEKEGPNAQELEPYPVFVSAPHVISSDLPLAEAEALIDEGEPLAAPLPQGKLDTPTRHTDMVPLTSKKRPSDNEDHASHKRLRQVEIQESPIPSHTLQSDEAPSS